MWKTDLAKLRDKLPAGPVAPDVPEKDPAPVAPDVPEIDPAPGPVLEDWEKEEAEAFAEMKKPDKKPKKDKVAKKNAARA